MCKCLAIMLVYIGVFALGIVQAYAQRNTDNIPESAGEQDLCHVGEWSAKPVWTLTYDAARRIIFLGSCGCVCIVDMKDPLSPQTIAEFEHSPCNTCGLFFQAETNRLFICGGISGLKIWDVSDPEHPSELGNFETPGYACAVQVVGTIAYVADGDGGLRIVDVSNPAKPKEISHIDMSTACCVYVEGTYAHVADLGLRIIDISNASGPKEVAFHPTPGVAYGVCVAGNRAFVADDWCGLRIIDISNVNKLQEIGFIETAGYAWDIQVAGFLAFLSAYDGGLSIIDVSNPAKPKEVASHKTPDKALQAVMTGSHIYVAAAAKGLSVYGFRRQLDRHNN